MTADLRRRIIAAGMALLLATAGVGWRVASAPASSQSVRSVAATYRPRPVPVPRATTTTSTTVPTTTTVAPTTTTPPTTAPPPPPPTTARPAPPTTAPPAPPTTRAPVVVTTVTPVVGGLAAATEAALLADVNARRATGTTCGGTPYPAVPPLTVSGILVNAAQGHANDMAARNYFSHTGTDGSDPGSRMEQAGYSLNAWAENIAAGQPSTGDVMASWWSSAGHCADFMNGAVSQIGFGMAQSSSSAYGIYWVADLANPA